MKIQSFTVKLAILSNVAFKSGFDRILCKNGLLPSIVFIQKILRALRPHKGFLILQKLIYLGRSKQKITFIKGLIFFFSHQFHNGADLFINI